MSDSSTSSFVPPRGHPAIESTNSRVRGTTRWKAIIFLLLFSACLAEFLTGSTRPIQLFQNPIGFLMLIGLYGGGSLLIREVAIRWKKRWGAILLLGGAYAVGEEGFAAKTMTDPIGSPVGNQIYDHLIGINWVPLSSLTLFHAAFSITVPLVILELQFPETRGSRLLGKLGFGSVLFAYSIIVVLLSLTPLGNPYKPPISTTIFLSAYAIAFILAAYFSPKYFLAARGRQRNWSELKFVLLGLGFLGSFFVIDVVGHLLLWPLQAFLFFPLTILVAYYLTKHACRNGNNDLVKIDFILGTILVFIPIDILLELGGDEGVLLFTGFVVVFVILLRRKILRAQKLQGNASS
jgi:hypothetical protein